MDKVYSQARKASVTVTLAPKAALVRSPRRSSPRASPIVN